MTTSVLARPAADAKWINTSIVVGSAIFRLCARRSGHLRPAVARAACAAGADLRPRWSSWRVGTRVGVRGRGLHRRILERPGALSFAYRAASRGGDRRADARWPGPTGRRDAAGVRSVRKLPDHGRLSGWVSSDAARRAAMGAIRRWWRPGDRLPPGDGVHRGAAGRRSAHSAGPWAIAGLRAAASSRVHARSWSYPATPACRTGPSDRGKRRVGEHPRSQALSGRAPVPMRHRGRRARPCVRAVSRTSHASSPRCVSATDSSRVPEPDPR